MPYDFAPRLAARARHRQQQRRKMQFWLVLAALMLTSLSITPPVSPVQAAGWTQAAR